MLLSALWRGGERERAEGGYPKALSTDAGCAGGPARSSADPAARWGGWGSEGAGSSTECSSSNPAVGRGGREGT